MRPPRSLLSRIGWSEGDVWTVSLGLALSLALAVSTIPAALHGRAPHARAVPAPTTAAGPPRPLVVLAPPTDVPGLPPLALPAPAPSPDGPPPARAARTAAPSGPLPATWPTVPVGAVLPFAVLGVGGGAGGLTTGPAGAVHAATDAPGESRSPSTLLTWDRNGRTLARAAVPAQPADRSRGVSALATTLTGEVLATDASSARLLRYAPPTRTWSVVATVPDVGPCLVPQLAPCQPGLQDTAPLLRGLAVDRDGTAYVADAGQGVLWRLSPGGAGLESWYAAADLLGDQGLAGIDVDASGAVLITVTRLPGLMADGSGTLDRLRRNPDASAGARTTITRFAPGEDVVDVAVGSAGVYVALRGSSAVVTLTPDGSERLRVTGAALTQPTALSLSRGCVLVTTGGPRPAVLQVGVADRLS